MQFQKKENCTYNYGNCPYLCSLDKGFWEHGDHYQIALEAYVFYKTLGYYYRGMIKIT